MQARKPHELYSDYQFDKEVRFFTDFMQSQMTVKHNQLFTPTNAVMQPDFLFFSQGNQIYRDNLFDEQIEDKVRL